MTDYATTLPAFLDALRSALSARTNLAGVNVYSCPVAPEDLGEEGIEFAEEVAVTQSSAAMGSTAIEESYVVRGSLLVYRPITPSDGIEVAAKAARDRAHELLAEVIDELSDNDTMSATVRDVTVTSQTWHQGMGPEGHLGRSCWVEFELTAVHEFSP